MKNKNREKIVDLYLRIETQIQWILSHGPFFIVVFLFILTMNSFLHLNIFTIIEVLFMVFASAILFITFSFPWPNRIDHPYGFIADFELPSLLDEVKKDPRTHSSIHVTLSFFTISSFFVILEFIMYPTYNIMYLSAFVILCIFSFILLLIYPSIHKNLIEKIESNAIGMGRFNKNDQQKDVLAHFVSWKMTFSVMYSGMLTLWGTIFSINRDIAFFNYWATVIFLTIILLSFISFIIFLYCYKNFSLSWHT